MTAKLLTALQHPTISRNVPTQPHVTAEVRYKYDAFTASQKRSDVYGNSLAWEETACSLEALQRIKVNSDFS